MNIRFNEDGLVPAIAQDARTGRVLMMAWANQEALASTVETGYGHYFSRSRQALWKKGETSGNLQRVLEVRADCDADTLLYLVQQDGPACHTGAESCFFRVMGADGIVDTQEISPPIGGMSDRLAEVIHSRRTADPERSYTASLLTSGMDGIVAKIREESGELVDALNNEDDRRVVSEAADLLYHVLVGFSARGIAPHEVALELGRRFGLSGLDEKASRSSE
jgi:phosphoribosyl-ATP pyrophosphohydrolase/phosphoribosyl-AMP cyclohydrolase